MLRWQFILLFFFCSWYREGSTTPVQAPIFKGGSKDQPTFSVLSLTPRREDDGVKYRCAVWNRAMPEGQRLETTLTLNVNCKYFFGNHSIFLRLILKHKFLLLSVVLSLSSQMCNLFNFYYCSSSLPPPPPPISKAFSALNKERVGSFRRQPSLVWRYMKAKHLLSLVTFTFYKQWLLLPKKTKEKKRNLWNFVENCDHRQFYLWSKRLLCNWLNTPGKRRRKSNVSPSINYGINVPWN